MFLNNRKIQSGEEESDGFDRPYGKSRLDIHAPRSNHLAYDRRRGQAELMRKEG